jgi:hypothetical protein
MGAHLILPEGIAILNANPSRFVTHVGNDKPNWPKPQKGSDVLAGHGLLLGGIQHSGLIP